MYSQHLTKPLNNFAEAVLQLWTTPVQIIISLLLATGLTFFVEEPSKNKLRLTHTKPENPRRFHLIGLLFVILGITFADLAKLM